jgi:hypothetical protein
MNILITILLTIAGIVALLLILALFAKKQYAIGRDITINKPTGEVFSYLKYLKNQDHYNKWVMRDPGMKKEFRGTDGTDGFVYAWDGNKDAGAGEQEIKKITDGQRIDLEIRFTRPFAGIANSILTTGPVSDAKTNVKWTFNSSMKYPANVVLMFMNMDKILGRDLETSLTNLKVILEK